MGLFGIPPSWVGLGHPSGVGIVGPVAVGTNGDGRLELFLRTSSNELFHSWQEAGASGGWAAWASLGSPSVPLSPPTVQTNPDGGGRLEVFSTGSSQCDHIWQNDSPPGGWSDWSTLGGDFPVTSVGPPTTGKNSDGRLEVFAATEIATNQTAVSHIWQTEAGDGWTDWTALGASSPPALILSAPLLVGQNGDGRLEVFAQGADNNLYHTWQLQPGGLWSDWESLGGAGGELQGSVVANNLDGRLEVFTINAGIDSVELFHNWQTTSGWSGWGTLGSPTPSSSSGQFGTTSSAWLSGPLAVARNADGRLEIFAGLNNVAVWHIWQVAAGGAWSNWAELGTPSGLLENLGAAINSDGRLEVFALSGADVFHRWQVTAGGGWS
jgi:hypothetical protein